MKDCHFPYNQSSLIKLFCYGPKLSVKCNFLMAQKSRIRFLEQEVRLPKSEVECERFKTQKLRAAIKMGKTQASKTRPKDCTVALDIKQEEMAKFETEVGANNRTDGLGKLSALEIANQKLSVQIDDLILATEREIYGMDATTRENNKQDRPLSKKNHVVHPHIQSPAVTTRRKSKIQTGHPSSSQQNPVALRSVARVLAQKDDADRQHPVTPKVPLNPNRKVVEKQPKSGVCNPVGKANLEAVSTANLDLSPSRDRKMRQCASIQLAQTVSQKIQSHSSKNLVRSSPVNERQTSPRLLSRPVTRDLDPGKCAKNKDALQNGSVCPTRPDAYVRTDREIQREIRKTTPKKITPRTVRVKKTDQNSNEISTDMTHVVSRMEQEKTNFDELRSQTTNRMSPRGDMSVLPKTPLPLNIKKDCLQKGDFQHQRQVTLNPYSNQNDDESVDDLRLLLENIVPCPANSNSSTSQNSSPSISPKNNNLRPWYELLPIPNVEFVGKYQDLNNTCSTDSDSSGRTPLKPSPPPRRELNENWTYLGDQTALMPRPVVQKSCRFVENFDSLSLTDEDIEFKDK